MTTTKFETGATTHAVNDLILFTDNTRELAEQRDWIYLKLVEFEKDSIRHQWLTPKEIEMNNYFYLLGKFKREFIYSVVRIYNNELGKTYAFYKTGSLHVLKTKEKNEFGRLYAADFNNWKQEHNY